MSLLLRPGDPGPIGDGEPPRVPTTAPLGLLPLIAAVAVCDVAGEDALIKWPNDIVLGRPGNDTGSRAKTETDHGPDRRLAKLAGILVEGRPQAGWAVLGIGLNVAVHLDELPVELRAGAARRRLRPECDRADARAATRRARAAAGRAHGADPRCLALARRAARPRDRVGLGSAWARARGIDAAGHLLVALDRGRGQIALDAGEVHLGPAC